MAKSWMILLGTTIFLANSTPTFAASYSGGPGTPEDPYQIQTPEQINTIGVNPSDWGKSFKLMADIDMSAFIGTQYNIIGNSTKPFTGTFDGNRHLLTNLTIMRPSEEQVGLFRYIGFGGCVKNLGLEHVNISGQHSVGSLVGRNEGGIITACYASGTINGNYWLGGLVGLNYGSLTACYAINTISGSERVGGLVGENYNGQITACYATGRIIGSIYVGGLVGWNEEGMITSCFWDLQTSGQADSSGGKGLTTEQMKTLSIYQNAGWADRGWVIQDGIDRPRLSWENIEGAPIPPAVGIPFAGSGTAEDPYVISTAEEFAALSWYSGVLDKFILLNNDLDLSGVLLYPIGDLGRFTGVFEGQGHILRNVSIQQSGSDNVGLFSIVDWGGQIRNLGLEHGTINGRYRVGGLVGWNFWVQLHVVMQLTQFMVLK